MSLPDGYHFLSFRFLDSDSGTPVGKVKITVSSNKISETIQGTEEPFIGTATDFKSRKIVVKVEKDGYAVLEETVSLKSVFS